MITKSTKISLTGHGKVDVPGGEDQPIVDPPRPGGGESPTQEIVDPPAPKPR